MTTNRIQGMIKAHAKRGPARAPVRRNRTFHLDEDKVMRLQQYCVSKGLAISKVVDELIDVFLEEAGDAGELPPGTDKGG